MSVDASFAAMLTIQARARPSAVALTDLSAGNRRATFGELESLANRYANGLTRQGVRQGDRVLYFLPPSIDGYAVFYALLRIGAVPVLLDPRRPLRDVLASVSAARVRVLIGVPGVHALRAVFAREAFRTVEIAITAGRRWFWGGARLAECLGAHEVPLGISIAPSDPSFLPFTSGSTGPAKAVFYDHGMLTQQVGVIRDICGWQAGMRVAICFAPFVPYALADGLSVILPDMDFSRPATAAPDRLFAAFAGSAVDCAVASPVIWRRLATYCAREGLRIPTLRRALSAGAPVPPALHHSVTAILGPGAQLYTPYGATEAMPIASARSDELADTWQQTFRGAGLCVGRPLPGLVVRIISIRDEPIAHWHDSLMVAPGVLGEIVVEGGVVSSRYADNPAETIRSKIDRDGSIIHRMGDLGWIDHNGRLWLCGRKAHRIATPHGTLPPDPIENIFDQHPSVCRSAVVGVPRGDGFQIPVACLELEKRNVYSPRLEEELTALTRGTRYENVVTSFLPHPGLPVDPRHNAKIRRELLIPWATRQVAARARQP